MNIHVCVYISNIMYPIWKYIHTGFPPTPPHTMLGSLQRGRGEYGVPGLGWGGEGIPYDIVYISTSDIGYWIFIYRTS